MTNIQSKDVRAIETLLLIAASGRTLRARGNDLIVSRGASMCEELKQAIRWNKPELLKLARG